MKTSNKLLITFALALILVPLMGMIYESRVHYVKGEVEADMVVSQENFSTASKNMKSIALNAAFQTINIADAKGMYFRIRLIKDDKFGIKIPERVKDLISASVDANGQLQISVKAEPSKEHSYSTLILVYAPNVNQLNLTKAAGLSLEGAADSLNLAVNETNSINLANDVKVNKLSITTTGVDEVEVRETTIQSLTLNLQGANFKSTSSSFDYLAVTAAGKAEIEINGGYDEQNTHSIKNLVLNTLDKADVKLENIKVDNCEGRFSDQTKVQMPAVNLNQMYKK